jgi:hypothetical protein
MKPAARRVWIVQLVGCLVTLVGCGPDRAKELDEVRAKAAADLACPIDQIAVVDLGAVGKGSDDVRATGCMGVAWYGCDSHDNGCPDAFLVTRVSGAITIDGVAFVPAGPDVCIPGDRNGFFGVDLHDASGALVRLIEDPADGAGTVVRIRADGSRSRPFTGCADLRFTQSGDRINGTAHLECFDGTSTIQGALALQECAHDPWRDPG